MENGDKWLALDKLYHILFSFFISIFIAALATRTQYPFIRNWSIWFGSLTSMAVGTAKEVGDEIGLWDSAGASVKDLIADLLGIFLASLSLSLHKTLFSKRKPDETAVIRRVSLV
ncbi:hypothetical protein GIB67_036934 [Kingdonia uniflora]|uniref:Uncharacterized protein n=1 Tax=Kingdonia uniflora TaxID=39325 RepID=A0A7J7NVQ8_9MAGN|nr:hypothetical protein GIB67_036934 [Kingdonia uniflora]